VRTTLCHTDTVTVLLLQIVVSCFVALNFTTDPFLMPVCSDDARKDLRVLRFLRLFQCFRDSGYSWLYPVSCRPFSQGRDIRLVTEVRISSVQIDWHQAQSDAVSSAQSAQGCAVLRILEDSGAEKSREPKRAEKRHRDHRFVGRNKEQGAWFGEHVHSSVPCQTPAIKRFVRFSWNLF